MPRGSAHVRVGAPPGYRDPVSSAGSRLFTATVLSLTFVTAGAVTGCAAQSPPSTRAESAAYSTVDLSSASGLASPNFTLSASGHPDSSTVQSSTRTPAPPAQTGTPGASTPAAGPASTRTRPIVPSSPELFPESNGTLGAQPSPGGELTLNSSGGRTRDGKPYQPVVLTAADVWLTPTGGATAFVIGVDAGRMIGAAVQARVSYDLTGDGSWDRVETYRYFATDPKVGPELYTQAAGLRSSEGRLEKLRGGVVQLEVWSALGEGGTVIELAGSSLTIPYR